MQNILLEFSKFVKQQEKQELLEELEQLLKRTAPSAEAHQLRMALEASEEEIMALKMVNGHWLGHTVPIHSPYIPRTFPVHSPYIPRTFPIVKK